VVTIVVAIVVAVVVVADDLDDDGGGQPTAAAPGPAAPGPGTPRRVQRRRRSCCSLPPASIHAINFDLMNSRRRLIWVVSSGCEVASRFAVRLLIDIMRAASGMSISSRSAIGIGLIDFLLRRRFDVTGVDIVALGIVRSGVSAEFGVPGWLL